MKLCKFLKTLIFISFILIVFLCYCRARKWAEYSGRTDLMDKKLDNLTKYHLCSDHFSSDSFVDPNVEKHFLKLKKVPSIPMPTFFENNLLKTVQKVTQNPEKFKSYSKLTAIETSTAENRENFYKTKMNEVKVVERLTSEEQMQTENFTDYEELEIERADEIEEIDINSFCRLCARNAGNLIAIFNDNGDFNAETESLKLMPSGMIAKDDGFPQFTCLDCVDKLNSCLNIIDGFVVNQTLFVSE